MSTVRAAMLDTFSSPMLLESVSLGELGPHDVLIRVTAAGVCHTDLSAWRGSIPVIPPMVLGHEGCGFVEAVGSRVERIRIGDRVITSPLPTCGRCRRCVGGQPSLCEAQGPTYQRFVDRSDGSTAQAFCGLGMFSELARVHEDAVIAVSSSLPDEQLALLGCGVATGLGSVMFVGKVEPGATIAVVGCGGVGLAVVEGARVVGAERIIAIDPVAERREAAASLGATDTVDPADGPIVDAVRALTSGDGVDVSFEAAGRPDCAMDVVEMARRGGTAVLIGAQPMNSELHFNGFALKSSAKTLKMSYLGDINPRRDLVRFARMAEAGVLHLDRFISHRRTLADINLAFADLQSGIGLRTMLTFDEHSRNGVST